MLVRSSQPEVGWLGWRNQEDEALLQAIPQACIKNPGSYHRRQRSLGDASSSDSDSQIGEKGWCFSHPGFRNIHNIELKYSVFVLRSWILNERKKISIPFFIYGMFHLFCLNCLSRVLSFKFSKGN